ncbi:type I methionyl aminopeptidase [Patescibacteria group bacterium]|nr:type I methionyl aminopeptidase [Patescibacteria group bacterium]
MSISIKNQSEIEAMIQSGKLLSAILKKVVKQTVPGITTIELDRLAEELIVKAGAQPAFKNFKHGHNKFPACLCVSINEEIVHGIPSNRIIKNNDVIGLDCGLKYKDFFSDMAVTLIMGRGSKQTRKLVKVAKQSLDKAIEIIKPGIYLGDISNTIQSYVVKNNFAVVRDLTGHGIGRELHEEPSIFNYGEPGTGPILKQGMTLALEPMITVGDWKVRTLNDGWTIVTADNSLSAHFEHTILVTKNKAKVLTK